MATSSEVTNISNIASIFLRNLSSSILLVITQNQYPLHARSLRHLGDNCTTLLVTSRLIHLWSHARPHRRCRKRCPVGSRLNVGLRRQGLSVQLLLGAISAYRVVPVFGVCEVLRHAISLELFCL